MRQVSYKVGVGYYLCLPREECNKGQDPSQIYSFVKDPFRPTRVLRTDKHKDARS